MVRGENRSCRDFADLDFALDHPASDYFKGWTASDFDAAQAWISTCEESPPSKRDAIRQTLLTQRRQVLAASGETTRNEQAHAATRAKDIQNQEAQESGTRAAEEAQNSANEKAAHEFALRQAAAEIAAQQTAAAAESKRAAFAECARLPTHQQYLAATRVMEALDRESAAQRALDHEKRVEALSGVTNLATQRAAAEALVSAQDDEHSWWIVYRQNGGTAPNPQALSQSVTDPCG